MAYATQADIEELNGADALFVADRDGDGTADVAAVIRALEEAAAEMDLYLASRYTLPLSEKPLALRRICSDIALYRLALSRDVLSEELRTRYKDAMGQLRDISEGRAALNLTPGADTPDGFDRPKPIVAGGPERLFSRDKMRGL